MVENLVKIGVPQLRHANPWAAKLFLSTPIPVSGRFTDPAVYCHSFSPLIGVGGGLKLASEGSRRGTRPRMDIVRRLGV
jgi:hypothetical protein